MIEKILIKNKIIASSLVAVFAILIFGCGSALAWGPERTTYTNEVPADHATFNSITNNVAVGDERNFVRVRELGKDDTYKDEAEIVPGKEYEVYVYYHNNAASNTNATGFGMATNVRAASAYPTKLGVGERGMISGIISWSYVTPDDPDNAKEGKVWDEAYATTQYEGVVLRYKTGSAKIHNAGAANDSVLPTNLFSEDGTPIGYNKLSGTLPGCAEYSGYITYTLVAENTDSELKKEVSIDGEKWGDEVTVKPGDYVTYRVTFNNTGNTNLTNVIFKDTHDNGLSLRDGSTKVFDANNVNGFTIDDILDISGYNTGDAVPGALRQIIYQMQVGWDESLCNKVLNNTISVAYNSSEQKKDGATVLVACETKPEPEDPTEPDKPESPEEPAKPDEPTSLPKTGPAEIALASIIVVGLGIWGAYYLHTKKNLNRVKASVINGAEEKKKK